MRIVPHSNGEDASPLTEFNACHAADTGQFCSDGGVTVRVYHGTRAAFGQFSDAALGINTKARTAALGHFFTDSPKIAEGFAQGTGGNIRRATITLNKPFELTPSHGARFTTTHGNRRAIRNWDRDLDPFMQLRDLIAKSTGRASWKDVTVDDVKTVKARLVKAGYDGFILRDTVMDAGSSLLGEPRPVGTIYIVFDTKRIRESKLREFNPCHSPEDGTFCSGSKFSAGKMPMEGRAPNGYGIAVHVGHNSIQVDAGPRTIAEAMFLKGHTPGKLTRVTTSQVASEFQRKGWGVWLYKRMAEAALAAGATGIWSSSHGRNAQSDRVWASLERKGLAERFTTTSGDKNAYRMPPAGGVKLREANDCHTPAGSPAGGQFCSGKGKGETLKLGTGTMHLKLGSSPQGAKARATAAVVELRTWGYANPFDDYQTVIDNEVIVEAAPFDGKLHLAMVKAVQPKGGAGTRIMKRLADLADKHGVEMTLSAVPLKTDVRIPKKKLVEFYKRFGFVLDGPGGEDMVRKPRSKMREFNSCHSPKDGTFCSGSKAGESAVPDVDGFVKALGIKQQQVSSNEVWEYVDTPRGQAGLSIKDLYDGKTVEIHWLNAQRRGSGRAAMERIVELADKHKVTLTGWAAPLPGQGENEGFKLSRTRLEKFYRGFGFRVRERDTYGYGYIVRKPRSS